MLSILKKPSKELHKEGIQTVGNATIMNACYPNDMNAKDTLISINELLQYMTNLDYVKEMIRDAEKQSEMLSTVACSSEEVASSTQDIASFVQESNVTVDKSIEEANSNLDMIISTFQKIGSNIDQTSKIKETIESVAQEAAKINSLVNLIKGVSDQTKILSLNASIEAARAGEHGNGFAVVANEVKALAENTRKQVDIINNIIHNLDEKIAQATGEIDAIVNSFDQCSSFIHNATGGIKGIADAMGEVSKNFTSISASVEEQTAATQEISSNIQVISQKSTNLQTETNRTGKAFFDISQKVDEIRINALSNSGQVDDKTMLELSITDHIMWKWRVYNMILGYVKLDVSKVGNHHECRLGKWIATLNSQDPKIKNLLDKMENPHAELHRFAAKAIQEYENKNMFAAEKLLAEIEECSVSVVKYLKELKKLL